MNARGNSLLQEEKERNKVNKELPRIEEELHELIEEWEVNNGGQFKVGGVLEHLNSLQYFFYQSFNSR